MSSKRWATKAKALAIAAGLAGCSVCLAEAQAQVQVQPQAHQLEPRALVQQQVPFLSPGASSGSSAESAVIGGGSGYGHAQEGDQTTAGGSSSSSSMLAKPLFGRFLHVTDMHPDSCECSVDTRMFSFSVHRSPVR